MDDRRSVSDRASLESSLDALHVTTGHRPDDTRIFLKECRSLAANGYHVGLLAPEATATVADGVTLQPLPLEATRWRRLLLLPLSVFWRCRRSPARLFHVHDSALLPVGLLLKALGNRVVYDAHEDTPSQVMTKTWIPPLLRGALSRLIALVESRAGRVLDAVVAATPAIAARFPPRRTYVVRNFPLPDDIRTAPRDRGPRPPLCVYVGLLNAHRGAAEMFRALDRVTTPAGKLVVAGALGGDVDPHLAQIANPERISLAGWLGRDELRRLLDQATVGLLLFHPAPNHDFSLPTKLFEYMAAGLPVIASDLPAWREIVERERCGILVDPFDVDAIASALDDLWSHPQEALAMGERGRQAVHGRYNWTSEAGVLLGLYGDLLK